MPRIEAARRPLAPIAVLGFGSLPNELRSRVNGHTLKVKRPASEPRLLPDFRLQPDSPFCLARGLQLPVRLGRLSSAETHDERITCVLYEGASEEPVFFAYSEEANLDDAIRNLRLREGIAKERYRDIGYIKLDDAGPVRQRAKSPKIASRIGRWAQTQGLRAVVWTDLSVKGFVFSASSTGREIIPLLRQRPRTLQNTQDYIRRLATPLNPLQSAVLEMPALGDDATLRQFYAPRDTPRRRTPEARKRKAARSTRQSSSQRNGSCCIL